MTSSDQHDPRFRPATTSVWPAAPVAATVALVSLVLAAGFPIQYKASDTGLLDLRIYLGAAREVFTDGSIYDFRDPMFGLGSTYPPLWSLLMRPLTALDVEVVEFAWSVGVLVLWFATLWLLARPLAAAADDVPRPPASPWWVVAVWGVTLFGTSVWNTLGHGQVNVLIWLLLVWDLRAVLEHRRRAGVGIGLTTAVKLHPGLVAVLLAGAGRLTVAVRAFATFVAVTVLTAAVLWSDSVTFWTARIFDTGNIGDTDDPQSNTLRALYERADLPAPLTAALVYGAIAIILVVAVIHLRRALAARALVTTAVIVGVTGALVAPISWQHHLVFLGFPLLLVRNLRVPPWAWAVVLAVGAVLLVDPVGGGKDATTSAIRTLVMAGIVFGAGALLRLEVGDASRSDGATPAREWSAR